jgi:hypothetical protein
VLREVSLTFHSLPILCLYPSSPVESKNRSAIKTVAKLDKHTISLINIIPTPFPTHHIIDFFPFDGQPLIDLLAEDILVWAGAAFKAVRAGGGGAGDLR